MQLPPEEIATVVTAIGNHDEGSGVPVNPIAAALILADKSDVRCSRSRNQEFAQFSSVTDFFEIFLTRMRLCRRAACCGIIMGKGGV